jgi:hypothetical protein
MDPTLRKHAGGRPRKGPTEVRTKRVTVCLSLAEFQTAKERAQAAGLGGNLVEFMRRMTLTGGS